jgi:G protein beta subunit-like protein
MFALTDHLIRTLCTTSSDKTAKLWDVDDEFSMSHSLAVHTAWVWDCAFSGDSKYLVTGSTHSLVSTHLNTRTTVSSDHTGCIWDAESGELKTDLKGHQKAITAVALADA